MYAKLIAAEIHRIRAVMVAGNWTSPASGDVEGPFFRAVGRLGLARLDTPREFGVSRIVALAMPMAAVAGKIAANSTVDAIPHTNAAAPLVRRTIR